MNTETDEIKYFQSGEEVSPPWTEITEGQARILLARPRKERANLLKSMKKKQIRAKKKELGRKLTVQEMKSFEYINLL